MDCFFTFTFCTDRQSYHCCLVYRQSYNCSLVYRQSYTCSLVNSASFPSLHFASWCTEYYALSSTCSKSGQKVWNLAAWWMDSLVNRLSCTFSLVYSLPRLTEMKLSGNMNTEITDSPIYDKVTCPPSYLVSDWFLSWLFIG
jgi:hypothetical protein